MIVNWVKVPLGVTLLIFPAGTTNQTISVPIIGDTDLEPDESFFIQLASDAPNPRVAKAQGMGTIINDDTIPAIHLLGYFGYEGDATNTRRLTLTLSGPTPQVVTVDYATADGAAIAGTDYLNPASYLSSSLRVLLKLLRIWVS